MIVTQSGTQFEVLLNGVRTGVYSTRKMAVRSAMRSLCYHMNYLDAEEMLHTANVYCWVDMETDHPKGRVILMLTGVKRATSDIYNVVELIVFDPETLLGERVQWWDDGTEMGEVVYI